MPAGDFSQDRDGRRHYEPKIAELKQRLGNKCAQCGSTDNLEFDHIYPTTKLFVITQAQSVSTERLDAELAKCQLLCHECHKLKSIQESGKQPVSEAKHGSN